MFLKNIKIEKTRLSAAVAQRFSAREIEIRPVLLGTLEPIPAPIKSNVVIGMESWASSNATQSPAQATVSWKKYTFSSLTITKIHSKKTITKIFALKKTIMKI